MLLSKSRRNLVRIGAVVILLAATANFCQAVEISWDAGSEIIGVVVPPYPGDGLWSTAENWRANNTDQTSSPNNVLPGAADRANIGLRNYWSEVEAPVTITTGDAITVTSIRVGTNPGWGVGGHGKLIIDDGLLTVDHIVGGTGNDFRLGADNNRTGHMIVNAGTVTVTDSDQQLTLGYGATSTVGIVDFFGGTINANGGLDVGGDEANADRRRTTGIFTMGTPGDPLTAQTLNTRENNFELGRGGTGTFLQESGTVNVLAKNIVLGQGINGVGTYTLNDGALDIAVGQLNIANQGKGTFTQNGGTVDVDKELQIGNTSTSANTDGLFEITGGTMTIGSQLRVGTQNLGAVHQTGGTVDVGTGLILGYDNYAAADGYYLLDGGTLKIGGHFPVGHKRKGVFDFIDSDVSLDMVSGKTIVLGGTLSNLANNAPNSDGTLNLGDGTTSPTINAYQVEVGRHGKGVLNHNSGTLNINREKNLIISQYANGDGTYNMSDGLLDLRDDGAQGNINFNRGTGVFNQTGGVVAVGGNINLTSTASGDATYNLDGGLLDLRGDDVNFGPGTAAFTFTDGRLQDVGTFNSTLDQTGGVLAPGAGIGTMLINGDYNLAADGTLEIEVQAPGLTAGTDFDYLNITGNALLEGAVNLLPLDYQDVLPGDTFDVLTALDIDATSLMHAETPPGVPVIWSVIAGGNGEILRLTVVPEPSTIVLWGLGAIGLLFWRRRNKLPILRNP